MRRGQGVQVAPRYSRGGCGPSPGRGYSGSVFTHWIRACSDGSVSSSHSGREYLTWDGSPDPLSHSDTEYVKRERSARASSSLLWPTGASRISCGRIPEREEWGGGNSPRPRPGASEPRGHQETGVSGERDSRVHGRLAATLAHQESDRRRQGAPPHVRGARAPPASTRHPIGPTTGQGTMAAPIVGEIVAVDDRSARREDGGALPRRLRRRRSRRLRRR